MIFKQSTATKLETARQDLAATEKAILDAQQDRLAKLLDAAPEEITRLDGAIDDRQRQAQIFRDRIVALEGRLAEEQAEEQKRTMLAAVDGPLRKAVDKRAKTRNG